MLLRNSTFSPSVVIAEFDDSYTQISLFHLPIGHTFPVIRGTHFGTLFLGCLSPATCLAARLGDWLAAGLDFQHEGDFCRLCQNYKILIKYVYKATSPEIHAQHEPARSPNIQVQLQHLQFCFWGDLADTIWELFFPSVQICIIAHKPNGPLPYRERE